MSYNPFTGVASFNGRQGVVTLTYSDVTGALGLTPVSAAGAVSAVAGAATGILKSNGSAISAAVAATDYVAPGAATGSGLTMATARLLGRTTSGSGAVEELSPGACVTFEAGAVVARGSVLNLYKGDSGTYLLNQLTGATLGTSAPVANQMDFYPLIPLADDLTISALAIYVTTGVASTLARVGIYADNNGKPDGGALIGESGALDTATSSTAREGALSVTLSKGTRYWLAVLTNGAPSLRGLNVAAVLPLPAITDLSSTSNRTTRRAAQTYGALPSTAPTTSVTATVPVAIGLKIA
jgi:hypothetical protein